MDEYSVTERWLPVTGYEGYYEVSDLGRVRSLNRIIRHKSGTIYPVRGRVLKGVVRPDGHLRVTLSVDAVKQVRFVHRLVLEGFVGACPLGMQCCHNNGNPTDNRLINLRWDTSSANHLDRLVHGDNDRRNRTCCPVDHLLQAPNLVASAKIGVSGDQIRRCLACNRAGSNQRYATARSRVFDFKTAADRHYARIMGGG